MNPSSILMGFLFFVLELPGAKAPASLPRAASLTSAGDLSAHHFPTKSALRPLMLLSARLPPKPALRLISPVTGSSLFSRERSEPLDNALSQWSLFAQRSRNWSQLKA